MCYITGFQVIGYLIEGVINQVVMASYELFIERVKDIHKIGAIQGHLGWDQETIMPAKGSKARSEIMSWLAKEQHERVTNEKSRNFRNRDFTRFWGNQKGTLQIADFCNC